VTVAIINSGGANLGSVQRAVDKIGFKAIITKEIKDIIDSTHVIIPGVGSAHNVMRSLKETNLIQTIKSLSQPVLGICIGMQILFEFSDEGKVDCLGLIPGSVERFKSLDHLKVPQMGWNKVSFNNSLSEFDNYYYFANSYFNPINQFTIAQSQYGVSFTAAIKYKNFIGCQFHPEKSSLAGSKFLKNFLQSS
jgi:glutamine amidotransferase